MSNLNSVRKLAKQTLTIQTPTSEVDDYLWDSAKRLVRNVELLCQLPEISGKSSRLDHFCLLSATYFSGAGIARYAESHQMVPRTAAYETNSDGVLDLCVEVVEEKLGGLVGKSLVDKITRIICESSTHSTSMVEAMILSDARNFEDTGLTGIFNEYRRHIIGGRGISGVLQSWKKKIDYRYWQARLKESFRFDSVRKLASQRLEAAEQMMDRLDLENSSEDLKTLLQR